MDINSKRLLEAIKKHLSGEKVQWSDVIAHEDWLRLFNLAAIHKVLPMVYEAVYDCPSYKVYKEDLDRMIKGEVQR